MTTAAIVLAAGGSSRLGMPKQLVRFAGRTLVAAAAETCLQAGCSVVTVVVGCQADAVANAVSRLPVRIVRNEQWSAGQASSIRAGLNDVEQFGVEHSELNPERLLITLCDMPAVTSLHLRALLASCNETSPIAATAYGENGGVPACYHRRMFDELRMLTGDQGAKSLIRNNRYRVALVECPGAEWDIDVPADLQQRLPR